MDITKLKLGKKPAKKDPRDLLLADYLTPTPSPVPPSCDWYGGRTQFGFMLSNSLSNCTCAAVGHGLQVATLNTPDGEITPVDDAILGLYEKACGYVPGDPSTDNGGDINTVLNSVRTTGLGKKEPGGHVRHHMVLYAYASINKNNINAVKQAIALFGVVDLGIELPISAQAQVGGVWDVTTGPDAQAGSWGGHCLSGDTEIALLNGQNVPIADLEGQKVWVYSIDTSGRIVPGHASRIWKTGVKATVRVWLDNEEFFECTPEHLVLLRNGEYLMAKMLRADDSLMPLYRRFDKDGYERVYDPASFKYLWTHRVVGESLLEAKPRVPLHHRNENKHNNTPENLESMSQREHNFLHTRSDERRATSRANMSKLWADPEWREKTLAKLAEFKTLTANKMNKALGRRYDAEVIRNNHKVVRVEPSDTVPVFDMQVDEHHNFALACGTVVHNSVCVSAYDANTVTCITWGQLQRMTWKFWDAYVDEAFSLFFNPWKNHEALQVEAFDQALQAVTA